MRISLYPRLCTASLMTVLILVEQKLCCIILGTLFAVIRSGTYARGITIDVTRDVKKTAI